MGASGAAAASMTASGHLVFMKEGVPFGVGFDPARLKVIRTPMPPGGDVARIRLTRTSPWRS